jgi:hypothetical protein
VKRWRFINPENLPRSRTYRNAWTDTGSAIEHDMPRAREILRGHVRKTRAAAFKELDVAWMRAMASGNGAEAARVEAGRQVLRDAPQDPRIDAASTVEELHALVIRR